MKLIFCPSCGTIINLIQKKKTYCRCRGSWGKYIDELYATIGGDAIPVGIDNRTFVHALKNRKFLTYNNNFNAFVIHESSDRIEREEKIGGADG